MGIVAAAANYFILLPMFEVLMPLEQVIDSFGVCGESFGGAFVEEKRS